MVAMTGTPMMVAMTGTPMMVAIRGGIVVGAAAVDWVAGGFPVALQVLVPLRRQGIGRTLLGATIDSAQGETALLRTWRPVPEHSPEARLFEQAGFRPTRQLIVFDTDGTRFEPGTIALLARAGTGYGPVATLRDAAPEAVSRLVAPYFTLLPNGLEQQLTLGTPEGYDLDLSPVLMQDGQITGVMLCRRLGRVLQIDLHVVAPAARRTAASLRLVEAVTTRARRAGLERVRFYCDPAVRDTVNLGRRMGAVRLPSLVVLTRRYDHGGPALANVAGQGSTWTPHSS